VRRITELAELSGRQKEALLNATIETVEDAHRLGASTLVRWLGLTVKPALTQREVTGILHALYGVPPGQESSC
jgi:hypothetical protein